MIEDTQTHLPHNENLRYHTLFTQARVWSLDSITCITSYAVLRLMKQIRRSSIVDFNLLLQVRVERSRTVRARGFCWRDKILLDFAIFYILPSHMTYILTRNVLKCVEYIIVLLCMTYMHHPRCTDMPSAVYRRSICHVLHVVYRMLDMRE